jgi:hypothetical protein
MIFAVDFDGTIVKHKYPEIGELLPKAKETLTALHKAGHKIIIWTCRYLQSDLTNMTNFLKANHIPYDTVNTSIAGIGFVPEPKVYADVYLDDRTWPKFPGWAKFYLWCETNNWI